MMTATIIRTDATVLDSLESKVSNLEREVAGMRAEVRAAYQLIRAMSEAMQAGKPLPAHQEPLQPAPAVLVASDSEDAPLPPLEEREAHAFQEAGIPPRASALLLATGGTLTAFLTALALDHASLTPGARPVTPETVRANVLSRSPRFKAFRGVYDRAGIKNLLTVASAREWLASEDPAAPGHTRYTQMMSGSLS